VKAGGKQSYGVISQKMVLFITIAVSTLNPTDEGYLEKEYQYNR
jgi:hypothetical protein